MKAPWNQHQCIKMTEIFMRINAKLSFSSCLNGMKPVNHTPKLTIRSSNSTAYYNSTGISSTEMLLFLCKTLFLLLLLYVFNLSNWLKSFLVIKYLFKSKSS